MDILQGYVNRPMTSPIERIPLNRKNRTRLILKGLLLALSVRLFRRKIDNAFPQQDARYNLPSNQYAALASDVDKWVKRLIFWRRKHCFYRSYCLLYILRQCDLPLALNFGFYPLEKGSRMHCWLTLDNQLFLENPDTASDFPVHLGTSDGGRTHYWTGS
jgi:hypothetical protein